MSTPSSPTADDAALLKRLHDLRQRNAVLTHTLQKKEDEAKAVTKGMKEAHQLTELEEERMTNGVLRKAEALQKEYDIVLSHLHSEEAEKAQLEKKLRRIENENADLKDHLHREEAFIQERMQKQLNAIAQQRDELASRLAIETSHSTSTPQPSGPKDQKAPLIVERQIAELKRAVRVLGGSNAATPTHIATATSTTTPTTGRPGGGASKSTPPPAPNALSMSASSNMSSSNSILDPKAPQTPPLQQVASAVHADPCANTTPYGSSAGRPAVEGPTTPFRPITSNPTSRSSANQSPFVPEFLTPTSSLHHPMGSAHRHTPTPNAELAEDTSMIGLLRRELDRLAALKRETRERLDRDEKEHALLEKRINEARKDREEHQKAASQVKSELEKTRSLTREMVAKHELFAEWNADREIHQIGGTTPSHLLTPMPSISGTGAESSRLGVQTPSDAVRTGTVTPASFVMDDVSTASNATRSQAGSSVVNRQGTQ